MGSSRDLRCHGLAWVLLLAAVPAVTLPVSAAAHADDAAANARQATNRAAPLTGIRTWEWRQLNKTPLATITRDFSQFAAMNGSLISLDLSYVVDISEITDPIKRATADARYRTSLRAYVSDAVAHGLQVEALAGSPHWVDPEVRYVTDIVQDFVTSFNRESTTDLVGLHYSMEPWASPTWKSQPFLLANEWLDTVARISQAQLKVPVDERVPLAIDVPYWLDGTTAPKLVSHDGAETSPTDQVIRMLDNGSGETNIVVVMAYRDNPAKTDGTVAIASTEFSMAGLHQGRVRVAVGQEIGDVQPARVTYHQKGLPALRKAMTAIRSAFVAAPAWGGLAIDDFAALSAEFTDR